jgi:hypothetical protein
MSLNSFMLLIVPYKIIYIKLLNVIIRGNQTAREQPGRTEIGENEEVSAKRR